MARQLNKDWDAAFVSRHMDALLALYLDDAVRMQPDGPAWMGKAEIREGFESNWARFFSVDVTNKDDDVLVLGDYVLVRGSSQASVVEQEGEEAFNSTAKFLSLRQISAGRLTEGRVGHLEPGCSSAHRGRRNSTLNVD